MVVPVEIRKATDLELLQRFGELQEAGASVKKIVHFLRFKSGTCGDSAVGVWWECGGSVIRSAVMFGVWCVSGERDMVHVVF